MPDGLSAAARAVLAKASAFPTRSGLPSAHSIGRAAARVPGATPADLAQAVAAFKARVAGPTGWADVRAWMADPCPPPVALKVACQPCGQSVRLQVRREWAPGRGTFPAHFFKVRHPDPATGSPCLDSAAYVGPYVDPAAPAVG